MKSGIYFIISIDPELTDDLFRIFLSYIRRLNGYIITPVSAGKTKITAYFGSLKVKARLKIEKAKK